MMGRVVAKRSRLQSGSDPRPPVRRRNNRHRSAGSISCRACAVRCSADTCSPQDGTNDTLRYKRQHCSALAFLARWSGESARVAPRHSAQEAELEVELEVELQLQPEAPSNQAERLAFRYSLLASVSSRPGGAEQRQHANPPRCPPLVTSAPTASRAPTARCRG